MRRFLFLAICLSAVGADEPNAQVANHRAQLTQGAKRAAAKPKGSRNVCDDLLQKYAAKPAGVTLIGCQKGQPGGQTVAVATYQVSGANAAKAEKFFQTHYGMGNLTFICCGWEPANGKAGQVESAVLKKINPNYSLLITMYSDAQEMEKALLRGDPSAWKNKRKVKLFIVEVKIVDV